MSEKHENRRVRMTKRLLKDALLELLEQKDLAEISVTEICESADVHRSTFYKYYKETSELLQDIEQEVLERIPVPPAKLDRDGVESLLCATTGFFDYVKENARVFRILFSDSVSAGFTSRMVELLCSQLITDVESDDKLSDAYLRLYIANGTVGMLREWIETDFPLSSREIAEKMFYFSRKLST